MKTNVSQVDRWIRVILAGFLAAAVFTNNVTGTLAAVFLALAAVLIVTAIVRFCPLYLPFGISTHRKKKHA